MATQKPDLTRVWANGAPPANVVDPDTTTPGKVNSGWQAEVPPFEHFNFLQKWFTQGLAHFNEQGIGVWDTDTTYPIDGLAKGSNGKIYIAVQEQSGNDPVSDGGSNWLLWVLSRTDLGYVTPDMFPDGIVGANADPRDVWVFEDTPVPSNIIIDKSYHFFSDSKLVPANGVDVRVTSTSIIYSDKDWADDSLGGTFTYESGCVEQRFLTKVTSPTGSFIFHIGWPENTIDESSGASFVFGGTQSFPHTLGPDSQLCVIGGGYDNFIISDAIASTIAGGAHHRVQDGASHSAILGGSYQTSNADYGVLGGGTQNTVTSVYGVCVGGNDNNSGDPAWTTDTEKLDGRSSFVGAGTNNTTKALRAGIVAGNQNEASGEDSFVGGGKTNTANSLNAVVSGGANNTASGDNSAVGGGTVNNASGLASFVAGSSNTASENYAVAFGEFGNAGATASMVTGQRAKAVLRGQRAHASGYFASQGDAQLSDLVARVLTSGSVTKRLDLFGGLSAPILIPDNTTWLFKIYLVGRNIDTDGENGAWVIEGAIKKDGTSGSAALVGTPTTTVINAPTDWNPGLFPQVSANTSDGSMEVEVSTGVTVTDDIRWVARISLTEVAG